jgi:hypothetical protein
VDEEKPAAPQRPRRKYKQPMGCLPKFLIAVCVIAVLLVIALTVHFFYLKKSNPDLTVKAYLTFTWENTKDTFDEYKEKAIEWKEWLAKSEKAQDFLDKMFPVKKATSGEDRVAAAPDKKDTPPDRAEAEPDSTGEAEPDTTQEPDQASEKEPAAGQGVHPEFQAAADEFRAGIVHFQKRENNEAFQRFRNAQDHLENYRKVNPGDPQIEQFEKELQPFIHAAMKDSAVR